MRLTVMAYFMEPHMEDSLISQILILTWVHYVQDQQDFFYFKSLADR